MPCHSVTLPGIEQVVARPVIFAIIEQVFAIAKLSKETSIYYHGATGFIQTPGSGISETNRDAKFSQDKYTFVEVTEGYQQGALQETHVHSTENAPVFQDSSINLTLRPVYLPSDVQIQIKYRSTSETEVRRWAADMFMKVSRGRDINLHTVKYTYPLPFPLIELIEDSWKCKEAVAGYGESFQEYVIRNSCDRLTLIATQSGEMRQLAIQETQTRIQGFFDFDSIPDKPTRNSDDGSWEIAFGYRFTYQRPDAVFIQYPVSIHNQFLPMKYIDFKNNEDDPSTRTNYYSSSYEALSLFEANHIARQTRVPYPYIRIPEFDDFKPTLPHPGTASVIVALCFLDEEKKDLISLQELGDYVIDPDIMEFLLGEYPYMLRIYHSVFHISVYKNGVMQRDDLFEITPELMVRSKTPLDLRSVYHVRIAVITDVELLLWSAIERLQKYPKALVKLLGCLNELIRINPDFKALYHRDKIKDWELSYIYWVMTGNASPMRGSYLNSSMLMTNDKIKNGRVNSKNLFFNLDEEDIDRYLNMKRRNMLTLQISGIVVRSVNLYQRNDRGQIEDTVA